MGSLRSNSKMKLWNEIMPYLKRKHGFDDSWPVLKILDLLEGHPDLEVYKFAMRFPHGTPKVEQ